MGTSLDHKGTQSWYFRIDEANECYQGIQLMQDEVCNNAVVIRLRIHGDTHQRLGSNDGIHL